LLVREDASQRQYPLRELFDALRYVVRMGCTGRYLPHDLPPWAACYQQRARWRDSRVFEALTDDLRQVLRLNEARRQHLHHQRPADRHLLSVGAPAVANRHARRPAKEPTGFIAAAWA
jgi:transposase